MSNQSKIEIANDALKKEGKCPSCLLPLEGHSRCEACLILCGPGHDSEITTYRKHQLCSLCIKKWGRLERTVGRKVNWSEFLKPTASMSDALEGNNGTRTKTGQGKTYRAFKRSR